jgi:hypothetical protein
VRERWETFSDQLADATKQQELCLAQWTTLTASHDQLVAWLRDVEVKVAPSASLYATLPDKKVALQSHKVTTTCFLSCIKYKLDVE